MPVAMKQWQILDESKPWSGSPSTNRSEEFITNIRRMVEDDHRKTINEIVGEVGISTRLVHTILTDLAMRRVSVKLVSKLLVE